MCNAQLRQRIRESERRYVAASVLWFVWISLLKTRQMQQRYLDKIQTSLRATRQLSSIFANDFGRFVAASHVVLHLPSLGHPTEMRRTIEPRAFAVRQNVMCLKVSFVRNPCTEVIYVLPVPPSEDLLSMYRDIVDSIDPKGAAAKRITYVTLSEAKTFERRSMNVTRILHCSEATLQNVRRRIARRPAYILPWIVDDCDVRLADHDLGLPMMGPDLEIQRELLNPCRVSEIFEDLDLRQPAHARHVRDYGAMCDTLAELIAINTEICRWHIRLNYGGQTGSYGAFLINHISVPFMPVLRRERAKYGDEWRTDAALRAEFLDALVDQLPKVVFRVTRLLGYYVSWKDFYAHVQKYGCLLQAVPDEKNATTVTVSLFVPGHATGNEPKWIGTADKIYFGMRAIHDCRSISSERERESVTTVLPKPFSSASRVALFFYFFSSFSFILFSHIFFTIFNFYIIKRSRSKTFRDPQKFWETLRVTMCFDAEDAVPKLSVKSL